MAWLKKNSQVFLLYTSVCILEESSKDLSSKVSLDFRKLNRIEYINKYH